MYTSGSHRLYIVLMGLVFVAFTVVFIFFPRTRYSELEKRELETFPEISNLKKNPEKFTSDVSHWFSDSEPYRDAIMTFSMNVRKAMRYSFRSEEDAVTFRPMASNDTEDRDLEAIGPNFEETAPGYEEDLEAQGNPLAEENAKIQSSGIIIVGNPPTARAFMAFGGTSSSGGVFIEAVNQYAESFPHQNIYALIASSPAEFYIPDKARKASHPETPVIENIRNGLNPSVKLVDSHKALAAHTSEDIFLRTDHHWAPLGAFYAAEAFAKTAGVPFRQLDSYDRKVVHNFVGTMYGYSKDIAIKQSPEDFVYYVPKDIDYTTTFITFNTDKNYQIVSESKPYTGAYFKKYKDGSGAAYSTFMGGDQQIIHVETNSPSKRKLLIIKDSFGNAIPGYLFYGFSDIHVVDYRYFNRDIKKYVSDNGITDILFAFNIFNVCTSSNMRKVQRLLKGPSAQKPVSASESGSKESKENSDNNKEKANQNEGDSEDSKGKNEPIKEEIEPIKGKTESAKEKTESPGVSPDDSAMVL